MPQEIKEKIIKAWAIVYKSSFGVGGLDWRLVQDIENKVYYPRIVMTKEEARDYGRERLDYKNFRIIPCEIKLLAKLNSYAPKRNKREL